MFKMASLKDKSNKLLLGVVNNKTMADARNDERVVDIDTLRQFTIPKMRKAKHELLEIVSTNSAQYQREILQVLHQSYQDRRSTDRFIYSHPRLVHNAPLLNEFLEKRKAMRQDRTDKDLQDTYGFISVKKESEVKKYCAEGITIGNSSMMCLGNPAMGVYLCKHADILQPSPFFDGQSGYIIIFKIIKGKTKLMVENRVGEPLDPTPDFDCHLSKNVNVDMTTVSIQEAYESTQLYVYEYTEDLDITERPRQVVPHAVVNFRFVGAGSSQQKSTTTKKVLLPSEYAARQASSKLSPVAESALSVNSSLSKRSSVDGVLPPASQKGSSGKLAVKNVTNEMSLGSDATDSGDIIWTGQLCMESAVISDVELVSYSNFNLPWHLEPWLNLDHDRIGYDEIMSYYQLGLLAILPRDQECRASGKFYNYCELRPMSEMSKNFLRAVNLISNSRCGSRIKLTKGVDLIILPHCTITYQLGLCTRRRHGDPVVLHCIIISTMSSTHQQDIISQPHESANQRSNEFPFNSQVLESVVDVAGNICHMPYQENSVSSHSLRQSLQFMQSYPSIPPSEQTLLQHGQHGSIPFSPYPAVTPGEAVHPLGLSSTADVPFSLSKQRHYDPRLARRLEMPSEFLPHITSDDVLRLNLPASDLPSALQTDAAEGCCPEQNSIGSGMRHETLQERIDRMQAEMEARGSPVRYYQSDADTETEYSPSSRFPPRGSSSSISEEDEELELDIIKLRRPTALVQLEKNTDEEQTNEEAMEVDEGNMADDLVDEIVRMKPLQAKAARETFGGPLTADGDSRRGKFNDVGPAESVSYTDCLFIDFDVEVSSNDSGETADNLDTIADDLAVIKSSLLTTSATEISCNVVDAASVAEPIEDVTDQKDGLSNEPSEPVKTVDPLKISEEHPSPKEVPDILSPISCDVQSNDNTKVPISSADVASSQRPTEEIDLSLQIASADEAVNSTGLTSPAQPETCLDESVQAVNEGARIVTFVETGKLSIEIHSDAQAKSSASDETIAVDLPVATSSLATDEETRLGNEEDQLSSCVASVLHRSSKRGRSPPLASPKEEEEAEHQLEMIWKLGLHYLAFFFDREDDDNREINAEEGPGIRSMTDRHNNAFASRLCKESVHEGNKSRPVRLSSSANKSNRVHQLGIRRNKCTTDVVRPKASLSNASRHQSGHSHNKHESLFENYKDQNELEIRGLQLLTNQITLRAQNIFETELPVHHNSQPQASLSNPEFVVQGISELQISTTGEESQDPKNLMMCNPGPAIDKRESALGALQRYCSSSSSSNKSNKYLSSSSSSSSSSSNNSSSFSSSSSSSDSSSVRRKSVSKSQDGAGFHSPSNEKQLTVNSDQVVSFDAGKSPRTPHRKLSIPWLLTKCRDRVKDQQHMSFSFEMQQTDSSRSSASGGRHVSSKSRDHRGKSKDQSSANMQSVQTLSRSRDRGNDQDSAMRSQAWSKVHHSLSTDQRSMTHGDLSLSRSQDFFSEVSDLYSVMKSNQAASKAQARNHKDRHSVVRRRQSFSRSRSRDSIASSRRSQASHRNTASSTTRTDRYNVGQTISSHSYRSASRSVRSESRSLRSVSRSVRSASRSVRSASRSVRRCRRSKSRRSSSTRTSSFTSRSRSGSFHRRSRRRSHGKRLSKSDRRRHKDSRSKSSSYSRYSSESRLRRSESKDRRRYRRRMVYSSSPDTGFRNVLRGSSKHKRRSRSISSGRQDSSYRYGTSSYYDEEPFYPNRTKDYQFRDDRAHPYYRRRQDGTRARIDRDDFFKVYREHRNLEELLECLTRSQFESRRTRPILTHLTSGASESMQSSPRFRNRSFERSTCREVDEILGRRDKVDDCLEDQMFGRDEVPNFYKKKAIADAFDDNFRPAASESKKPQQLSISVVSNPPLITYCAAATSSKTATSETAAPETAAAEGSSDPKSGKAEHMS